MDYILGVLGLTLAWGIPLLVLYVVLAVGESIWGKPPENGSRLGAALKKRLSLRHYGIPLAIIVVVHLAAGVGLAEAKTQELRKQLREAPVVRVRTGGMCHSIPDEVVMYETSDRQKIADLADRLRLAPGIFQFPCACCGDMTFETGTEDGESFAFSYHHGISIRAAGWGGGDRDLTMRSRTRLEQWLTTAGVDTASREQANSERHRRLYAARQTPAPTTAPND